MFRALSERVFGHLMRLPMRFHANRRTGAITQALENGLQGYQIVMHDVVFTFVPVLAELETIVVILSRLGQPTFLALFCGALVCYGGAFAYAAVAVTRPARSASAAAVDSTAAMTDPLLAVETVKLFTAEELVERRVSAALARTETEWVGFYRRYACNGIAVATIFATLLATTVAYATREVQLGRMSIGEFVLINTYMPQVVRSVEMVGYAMQGLSHGNAMLQKMFALLAETPSRTERMIAPSSVVRDGWTLNEWSRPIRRIATSCATRRSALKPAKRLESSAQVEEASPPSCGCWCELWNPMRDVSCSMALRSKSFL